MIQGLTRKEKYNKYGRENIDLSGNIIYPVDIKDKDAFEDWLILKKEYEELKKGADYQTSDPKVRVLLTTTKNSKIKREICELPKEEQKFILDRWKQIHSIRGKMLGVGIRAFKKKSRRASNTLTNVKQLNQMKPEVIHLFSKLYNTNEVWRILNHQMDIRITRDAVNKFRTEHSEEIRLAQEKYKETYDEVRLVHKRSRLEELLDLYNDRREIYLSTKYQNDYRLLLQTLEQIRKEVEGDRVHVDASLQVKIEHTLTAQQEEVMKELPIKMMIVAMVAGRMNVNPTQIMSQLANSYYAKYTGMNGNMAKFNSADITYPSSFIYNVNDMIGTIEKKVEDDTELAEFEEIEDKKEQELALFRAKALEKIKEEKKIISKRKDTQKKVEEVSPKPKAKLKLKSAKIEKKE